MYKACNEKTHDYIEINLMTGLTERIEVRGRPRIMNAGLTARGHVLTCLGQPAMCYNTSQTALHRLLTRTQSTVTAQYDNDILRFM